MIRYERKRPTSDEYNYLMNAVGWGTWDKEIVEEALNNTLFSICAYDNEKIVGYGRIIGDKTIFLHIHSLMVHPEYQNRHIGGELLKQILNEVNEYKKINPKIRTYVQAAKGKEGFYEKYGFICRPNEELGCGMILK